MQFNLSAEQLALEDATTGLLEACTAKHRGALLDGEDAFNAACWQRAAVELGLAGVAVPEDTGGGGGTLVDAAVVLEAAGRSVSTLPLWTAIGAGRLLQHLAEPAGAVLADVAAGGSVPGWAGLELSRGVRATRSGGDWVVTGRAAHVVGGTWTDRLLVLAESDTGPRLMEVQLAANRVTATPEKSLDPTRPLLSVVFQDAPAVELSSGSIDPSRLATVQAEISVLLAAEQVGVAQGALDMAVDHAKTRLQFGRSIGSFQSIKHLLADLYVDVETARSAMRYGAWALSAGLPDPEHIAHLTRAIVTPRAVRVCAGNLQVHGGIGYTWEHGAHLFYKRALSAAHLLHEVDSDLDAIAAAVGLDAGLPPGALTGEAGARR
jgi:alkylation response protein AidB-like acyl-CoA dehydrogenase